jgi:hypothetical protein
MAVAFIALTPCSLSTPPVPEPVTEIARRPGIIASAVEILLETAFAVAFPPPRGVIS